MTRDAQRFEIIEVVDAAQRAVRTQRGCAMIHLDPVFGFARPPHPHCGAVSRLEREAHPARAFRRDVPAARAAILVAALRGGTRLRPPVVVPERLAAAVAAPRAAARRQRFAAPGAAAGQRARERASGEQRRALGRAFRRAYRASAATSAVRASGRSRYFAQSCGLCAMSLTMRA
jgi:hypothetical protein